MSSQPACGGINHDSIKEQQLLLIERAALWAALSY